MQLLIKLILAHLLGDFILQPKSWVEQKERNKLKSGYLYAHFAIHGLLVHLFLQSWLITLTIVVTHAAIDMVKLLNRTNSNRRRWFFYDQLLHIGVIAVLSWWITGSEFAPFIHWVSAHLPAITAVVFLTIPSSVIINKAISRWNPDPENNSGDSLEEAGSYIGILERLFVFTFVVGGHWGAVGFLIAAKSVFRFGDLKESRDRKLTEYVLIGTLMSVGIASIAGVLVRYLS